MSRPVAMKHTALLGAAALVAALAVMQAMRQEARSSYLLLTQSPESWKLPDPALARFTTLGYHEAAADLAWLRTIIYFGQQATVRGKYQHFEKYVDTVISLDPGFHRIYDWAGVIYIYSRARITRQMVEGSIRYLELGVERFPADGEMQYMLGFDQYFELPPLLDDESKIRESKREGIEHLRQAMLTGSGPPWLGSLVANLASKQGMDHLALMSLYESLAVVEDPEARTRIIERIQEIEKQSGGSGFSREWESFNEEWAASYPYVSMDMFLLLRPRPLFPPRAAIEPVMESEQAIDALDRLFDEETVP